jgi:hypothetical protein
MKTFEVILKGCESVQGDSDNLVKRVNAPSREALDRFLNAYGLRRWLAAEPDEILPRQEEPGAGTVLDEKGNVIGIVAAHDTPMPGFTLARRWREAVCLAAIHRRPQEAAVLLAELIDLIEATGGLTTQDGVEVPVAADWPDLAVLYTNACQIAELPPLQTKEDV